MDKVIRVTFEELVEQNKRIWHYHKVYSNGQQKLLQQGHYTIWNAYHDKPIVRIWCQTPAASPQAAHLF